MRAVAVLALLVACETPDPKLVYEIANGSSQSCGSTNCADIDIPCEAVISIRILRPSDPTAPLFTICEPVPLNRNKDLCSIAAVDLADAPLELPKETLEVQVVIWERDDIINKETGELDCGQYDVKFDAVGGFPIAQQPTPAIGGHAFYHPGNSETRVTLGCTDLPALNECSIESSLEVTATVENFENLGVALDEEAGRRLSVAIGEPKLQGASTVHSLSPADLRTLALTAVVTPIIAVWKATIDLELIDVACIQVLEDTAQATATLTCTKSGIPPEGTTLGLGGVLLPKPTLDQILAALGLGQFPASGITIGIVVDDLGVPLAGETVMVPGGTVRYLSASRTSVGGSATTASGIFMSLDAPLGTPFSVQGGLEVKTGGRVQGKVTIVVLEK